MARRPPPEEPNIQESLQDRRAIKAQILTWLTLMFLLVLAGWL